MLKVRREGADIGIRHPMRSRVAAGLPAAFYPREKIHHPVGKGSVIRLAKRMDKQICHLSLLFRIARQQLFGIVG
ncbi:hypothetical protein [Serratia ureilytica]|uniref:hypothetical protein n=1 Tax=Serratia ureilytica TaxID=300181 RepID=UPI001E5D603F|nr:hypothetical protein [Serratia ureilytica]